MVFSTLTRLLLIGLTGLLLTGCMKDECTEVVRYTTMVPVYKKLDEIRQKIQVAEPAALENPGKIYYFNQYLFINEVDKGVHIIDNSDPTNPINLSFISIPGNRDIAVRGNLLYADNYIDLVAIDISDPVRPAFNFRTENVFENYHLYGDLGYLIEFKEEEVEEVVPCGSGRKWDLLFCGDLFSSEFGPSVQVGAANGSGQAGIAGSMARFGIVDAHLYVLQNAQLDVFKIEGDGMPVRANKIDMDWGMETIFPYEEYLFIGANNGVFIYDNSQPENPTFLSKFEHATACDPVFVSQGKAYVTLNGNGPCNSFANQLDVLDVTNIQYPKLLATHPMTDPKGLSVSENILFLCDGDAGLRIFDVTDPLAIPQNQLAHLQDFSTYDIIALPGTSVILVIGPDGFYQYDVKDLSAPVLLSKIPVQ